MYLVAVTGGIASGKTSVTKHLESLGAHRLDADQIAREVVEPGQPALTDIVEYFGSEVCHSDGTLNRAELGKRVFGKPEALKTLNALIHPRIFQRTRELFAEAEAAGEQIVVYDIPLLAESANRGLFDYVVTVESGVKKQHERLVTIRGMAPEEAEKRIASQSTAEERIALAHEVIDSSGTLAYTLEQTEKLWRRLQQKAQAHTQGED